MKLLIRGRIFSIFLTFFLLFTTAGSAETGVVSAPSGLSLRAEPSTTAKVLIKLANGSKVEILQKDGPSQTIENIASRWYKVSSSGKTGWVFGGFIKNAANPTILSTPPPAATAAVEEYAIHLSDNPDNENASVERTVKRRFGDKFDRKGRTLTLKFTDGKSLELVNDLTDTENRVLYNCLDYHPEEGLFLIHAALYEGTDYFFVSEKTGRTIALGGMPIFSPDRSKVAAANVDIMAGYDFNGIRIFRIQNDELIQQLNLEPGEWGPQNPRWISETEIAFEKYQGEEMPAPLTRLVYNSTRLLWELK